MIRRSPRRRTALLLTFDTNQVTEGTAISHTASSGDFTLNEAGIYRISYSVVGTNTSGTGNATVELRSDGTAIPGSNKSSTIATASDVVTLAADVLVDAAGNGDHYPEYGRHRLFLYQCGDCY